MCNDFPWFQHGILGTCSCRVRVGDGTTRPKRSGPELLAGVRGSTVTRKWPKKAHPYEGGSYHHTRAETMGARHPKRFSLKEN